MKNIKAPKIVTIGILTLITLVFWVGFEVFRTFTKEPEIPVPPSIIEPINPALDQTALSSLQGRMYLEEGQIGQTVTQTASPTPVQTVAPTTEPAEIPEASPSASPSSESSPLPEEGL